MSLQDRQLLKQMGPYQVELRQQDTSIRSMKYLVTLLVPDGRYMMGIGKWNGGNKKEAIKKAKEYA